MPWVHRTEGVITSLTNQPNGSSEFLTDDNAEVIAFNNPDPITDDELFDKIILNQKVLKAVVLSLNDGTLVPGSNYTNAQIKAIIKANM